MLSPPNKRVTIASTRASSLQDLNVASESKPIPAIMNRHSSQELNKGGMPTRYAINQEMLMTVRRSMDVGKLSPKQRPLPPLPASSSPSSSSSPSLLSPSIPPLSLAASPLLKSIREEETLKDEAPLSPTLQTRKPLPAPPTPKKPTSRTSSPRMIPTSPSSPSLSPSPSPSPSPPSSPPPSPHHLPYRSLSSSRVSSLSSAPNLSTPTLSPSPSSPILPLHLQEMKKANKHYSSPELVAAMNGGIPQRHLSAPSTMVDSQLNIIYGESTPLGASPEPGNSPNPHLRSWYLKKISQGQTRTSFISKEKHSIRQHKKNLPEIIEITSKDKVIKELIVTEAQYVDDLSVIIKVYMSAIKKLEEDIDITAIFSNIEELYNINKTIIKELEEIIPQINSLVGEGPCSPVGDVFLRHLDKLAGYTTYLCNKDLSARVVKKAGNISSFSELIKKCKDHPECNSLGLGDYLIKPVQRLCKYPLLFKELLKQIKHEDPQFPVVSHVLKEIEKLAEITNRTITNTEKLNEIKKIMGADINPFLEIVEKSNVIRDGVLFFVLGSKKEEVFFWLLDKIVLWHPTKATIRKTVVRKQKENFISTLSISLVSESEFESHKNSFSLKYSNSEGKEKTAAFCAQSYLDKLCWVEDIKAQVDKPS